MLSEVDAAAAAAVDVPVVPAEAVEVVAYAGSTALADADAPRRGVLCQLLKLVEAASPALATAGKETRKAIGAARCGQCCAKDAGVGKLAAQCLSTSVLADATRARTFATLVSKLRPALDMKAGAQQHAALAAQQVENGAGPL